MTKPIKSEWNIVSHKPVKINIKQSNIIVTLHDEFELIVNNYLSNKIIKDVNNFIETKCNEANNKNKFCEYLLNKYFTLSENVTNELVILMKQLIKSRVLFKSNLSRGLLLIYNNWAKNNSKFVKPIERIKNILSILKNIGITKGLEFLINRYSIT